MHQINVRKYQINYAAEWSEVSPSAMIQIAALLHSKVSVPEAIVRVFLILIDFKNQPFLFKLYWKFRESAEFKYDCYKSVHWVFYTDYNCTTNKLPIIRSRGTRGLKFYGPERECRGLVFIEFIEADMAYLAFRKNFEDPAVRQQHLDKLVAILYRDKNPNMPTSSSDRAKLNTWNGDPRCKYNTFTLEYHQQELAHLPDGYKYAILMFYHACHMEWENNHPNIFKKADANSEDTEGGNWAGALKSLAGGSLHMDTMMNVKAVLALRDLDDRIAESEERKANQTKTKP